MASSAVPNAAVRMVWGGGLSAESLGLDAAADKHDVSLQKQTLGELYAGKTVIGAGSFGKAIDAVHVASGTPVVLKVVKRRADHVGQDYVRRFVTRDNIFAMLVQLSAPARARERGAFRRLPRARRTCASSWSRCTAPSSSIGSRWNGAR